MKILKLGALVAMAVAVMSASAQPPRGGQGGPQRSPEQMAKMQVTRMSESLDLSKQQQDNIYEITLASIEERMNRDSGERPTREQMDKAREELNSDIKALLTEEQVTLYDKMMERMNQRQGQGRRQGGK